jgi:hypothetical protein
VTHGSFCAADRRSGRRGTASAFGRAPTSTAARCRVRCGRFHRAAARGHRPSRRAARRTPRPSHRSVGPRVGDPAANGRPRSSRAKRPPAHRSPAEPTAARAFGFSRATAARASTVRRTSAETLADLQARAAGATRASRTGPGTTSGRLEQHRRAVQPETAGTLRTPGEQAARGRAEAVETAVDDQSWPSAATNQFTVARTCVLMKKASQRVRKCVLIRRMFQVTCSCRSRSYGTPDVPSGATPLCPGTIGNRLSRRRRLAPRHRSGVGTGHRSEGSARHRSEVGARLRSEAAVRLWSKVAARHPSSVADGRRFETAVSHRRGGGARHRSAVGVRHPSVGGPRGRPVTVRTVAANMARTSPRSLRAGGDRRAAGRWVTADRRRRSSSTVARAPC